MNNPQKQTVYLPVKVEDATGNYIPDDSVLIVKEQGEMDKYWIDLVKPQEGYFFTPEQLNKYTANVIKQALETAAENTETLLWQNNEDLEIVSNRVAYIVGELNIKQSITNTFEETYKKFEV